MSELSSEKGEVQTDWQSYYAYSPGAEGWANEQMSIDEALMLVEELSWDLHARMIDLELTPYPQTSGMYAVELRGKILETYSGLCRAQQGVEIAQKAESLAKEIARERSSGRWYTGGKNVI